MILLSQILNTRALAEDAIKKIPGKKELFDSGFPNKLHLIYSSICEERGISKEEIDLLPPGTRFLSCNITIYYLELKKWLKETIKIM